MYPPFDANARFPHRVNRDGTIDAICPRCFVTIGTANREPDLLRLESAHICSAARLEYYHPQNGGSGKGPRQQAESESGHTAGSDALRSALSNVRNGN